MDCNPIYMTAGDFPKFAVVDVNTTSLEGSYTIHPFVQNKQLVRAAEMNIYTIYCRPSLTYSASHRWASGWFSENLTRLHQYII